MVCIDCLSSSTLMLDRSLFISNMSAVVVVGFFPCFLGGGRAAICGLLFLKL